MIGLRPRIPPSSTRILEIRAPRTRSYSELCFSLLWSWSPFCLQFWFCLLLHLSWYLFSLRFGFLHFPSALVLISSAFPSVNVSFCRCSLGPSFQRLQPQYEVWGNLLPHFVVSDSRIFEPPFLVFSDEFCYHPPTTVWFAYTTIQGGLI